VKRELVTRSEKETEDVGRKLAEELLASDVVYLVGDLGAGKTTLARGIAAGLGAVPRQVASPTFAILHEYAAADGAIVMRHLDLYRLADRAGELDVLGLPEVAAGAPIAVEWPGRAIRAVLPPTREIAIAEGPGGARRIGVRELPRSR
jgi:tRNA threonylcarbamoyladenosine biosynthesis protein TsaE